MGNAKTGKFGRVKGYINLHYMSLLANIIKRELYWGRGQKQPLWPYAKPSFNTWRKHEAPTWLHTWRLL
jgi:hypothetical protein